MSNTTKEIQMQFGVKVETFKVTFECDEYIFAECITNPAGRGFFTRKFINENIKK